MKHTFGALLLAAGLSRRAGPANKLTASLDGVAMVRRSLGPLIASACDPVIVVTGHQATEIERALAGEAVRFVFNRHYEEGMAASLRAGVQALPAAVDAVFVALGDMPHVKPATYEALMDAFAPERGNTICVPEFDGKPGNPVLFGRRHYKEMAALQGDTGAKSLINRHADAVVRVAVNDRGIQIDYDTVQGLT